MIRAQFLDALMDFANDQSFSVGAKMKLTYNMMKGSTALRWFKPCFKHYLSSNIQSELLLIEPADWEIAIFLPTDSFRKVDASSV